MAFISREFWVRHVYLPVMGGLAELAADSFLPSSQGVTVPAEEVCEGFVATQAGALVGIGLYCYLCRKRGKKRQVGEETGAAFLGGVAGILGMTVLGLIAHEAMGVTDISWWPR